MPHLDRNGSASSRARRIAAAALVAAALGVSGCQARDRGPQVADAATPTSAVSPGQQLYLKSCARCHGKNLQGKGNSPEIDQVSLASLGDQRLRLTIQSGKGKMPGFSKLSPTQVDSLVAYLKGAA